MTCKSNFKKKFKYEISTYLLYGVNDGGPGFWTKEKKGKEDPKDLTIDSLSISLDSISGLLMETTKALDSTTMELTTYKTMYTAVKEKVTQRDFDPTTMGHIIDSLRTTRDSTFSGLTSESKVLSDSVLVLQKELKSRDMTIDSMTVFYADKTPLINQLKQLKELLDAGIITQEEFDIRKQKIMEKW